MTTTPSSPTTSNTPTTTSTTDSTGIIVSTAETTPISPQEAADRSAAEKAWLGYQAVMHDVWKQPRDRWEVELGQFATSELVAKAIEGLESFVDADKDNWGEVVHHPYWPTPINGDFAATLMDCIDASNAGAKDATGKILSRGVEHQNTQVGLFRQADGAWKVAQVTSLPNLACPGAPTANQEKASIEAARNSTASNTARTTR